MSSVTPSNSLSTKKHTEKDNHVTMKDGQHGSSDEDENDHDVDTNEKITSGNADQTKNSNGINETGLNGNGHMRNVAGETNGNKSQHHTVSPEDVSTNLKRGDEGASSASKKNNTMQQGEANPVLRGMLTYIDNELIKKHRITGMWHFESSTETQPQPFSLSRDLGPDEDPKELPKDGEFEGNFKVSYPVVNSNGKTKTRTKFILEIGVNLSFTKRAGEEGTYDIKGQGSNEYGLFDIFGTAIRDKLEKEKAYKVELSKKYYPNQNVGSGNVSLSGGKKSKTKSKKRKLAKTSLPDVKDEGLLPDPSESFPSNVVCLRGKATRDSSVQDGVVHSLAGIWSNGLDLIQSDPKNELGFCNEFEYEHRSTVDTDKFPMSGRYTGWFNLTENGKKTRYTERDVVLRFKQNNAGYFNIEGKGTNIFGKYSITGTLDVDNVITLFRHFMPIKSKKSSQVPALVGSTKTSDSSSRMTLDDVDVPDQKSYDPIVAPIDGHFAAVSRGTFKVTEDGVHTCTGLWAQSRSHHTSNRTSNFSFGLEEQHAKQGIDDMKRNGLIDAKNGDSGRIFPVDSANYKGSFRLRKGTTPVIDEQIVMKFRKNTSGSYNVYGKGVNAMGGFDLTGTLIVIGKLSGNVELFRVYADPPVVPSRSHPKAKSLPLATNAPTKKTIEKQKPVLPSSAPVPGLMRRESSRQVKLPSHLTDDDPAALKARMMEKCVSILKLIQEKDKNGGRYFLDPVDPVAHGIPTYHQIITNPMDLGTIEAKMDANEIESPEEFARLTRLVFENAVKFNSNPMNFVHQTARDFLSIFNQKFRDVERMIQVKKPTKTELKEMKRKQQKEEKKRLEKEKKRKRDENENPALKQLSILQSSSQEVGNALQDLELATSTGLLQFPTHVSRNEFNVMTNAIRLMQTQMVHMQVLIEQLSTNGNPISSIVNGSNANSVHSLGGNDVNAPKRQRKGKKASKAPAKAPVVEPILPVAPVPTPVVEVAVPPMEEEPLTHEEQEDLTTAINEMSEDKIQIVINIIKESQPIDDDQEIELDIDQLDTATQQTLWKFAFKTKPKRKSKAQKKSKDSTPPPAQMELDPVDEQPVSETKTSTDKFTFGICNSDSDDEEDETPIQASVNEDNPTDEDNDEDEDDDSAAPDWTNISKPVEPASENDDSANEEDDAWKAALVADAAQTELAKERQEREEKKLQEQKLAKEKSLVEAAEKKNKLQAERKAKEQEEARKRDKKDKEEKERAKKAKDAILKECLDTAPTVDLDSQQRQFLNTVEEAFYENDCASPSSDFGF